MTTRTPTLTLPPGPLWMVDDESELVQGTVALLARELGAEHVRGTTDPREVAQWIERERPAALITDVRMPHVNGLELVTRLHARWGPVPVVVMTAYPTAQVDQQASAGRFAYLPKPFTFRSLREALARVCAEPAPSAFSGAIAVSMLDEVVQLYGLAQRTGTLRVVSPKDTGEIGFDAGRVVDAAVGNLLGVEAFNHILTWSSGSFSWHLGTPTRNTIQGGLSELLLEAYRLRDERSSRGGSSLDSDMDPFAEMMLEPVRDALHAGARAAGSNVLDNLSKLERAEGFLGAALFDTETGLCLTTVERSKVPGQVPVADAAQAHAEFVRANRKTVAGLTTDDTLEDVVISLSREYHLLRLCRRQPSMCFYLALDRSQSNLAMARHLLSDIERDTVL